jgi:hypothetical protein
MDSNYDTGNGPDTIPPFPLHAAAEGSVSYAAAFVPDSAARVVPDYCRITNI